MIKENLVKDDYNGLDQHQIKAALQKMINHFMPLVMDNYSILLYEKVNGQYVAYAELMNQMQKKLVTLKQWG